MCLATYPWDGAKYGIQYLINRRSGFHARMVLAVEM